MLLTEEQAKAKWCPHARQSWENYPTYNRMEDGAASEGCLCIASNCMAWRFTGRAYEEQATDNLDKGVVPWRPNGEPPRPEGDGWEAHGKPGTVCYPGNGINGNATSQKWRRPIERVGYCGAFGKAEG